MSGTENNALCIEGEMTIFEAADIHRRIIDACHAGSVCLHLGGVTAVDTTGVQLLEAARREVVRRNGTLFLTEVSAAVGELLRLSGLEAAFEIAEPEGGQ